MKILWKKILSLVLCVVMLVLIYPLHASAAGASDGTNIIHSVSMDIGSSTASVQVTSEGNSILIVALYNSESGQMQGIGTADIAESVILWEVSVTVSCVKVDGTIVKAFLLDRTSYAPLCSSASEGNTEDDLYYSVVFLLNDSSNICYDLQMIESGNTAARPDDPYQELYGFTGWYMEPETITEYDFTSPVTYNLFLYAGWGNPNGIEGLYTISEGGGTEASITSIDVLDGSVLVTVNTSIHAVLHVEFLDENTDVVLTTAAAVTSDYCEMETVSVSIDVSALPEYYIVRAVLQDADGQDMCVPYSAIRYTSAFAEFDEKTIDDFEGKTVVNFDDSPTNNFGVLSDDVKVIPYAEGVNVVTSEYEPAYDEDGFVTEMVFIGYFISNPNEQITNLSIGDIIMIYDIEKMPLLFSVGTIKSQDGGVFLTEDEDIDLTDCYEFIKVDMTNPYSAETDNARLMVDLVDFDTEYLKLDLKPGIDYRPQSRPYFHIKVNGDISI